MCFMSMAVMCWCVLSAGRVVCCLFYVYGCCVLSAGCVACVFYVYLLYPTDVLAMLVYVISTESIVLLLHCYVCDIGFSVLLIIVSLGLQYWLLNTNY